MNIYNKLYIKEYVRYPYKNKYGSKVWYLTLSFKKYWYYHRNFDLVTNSCCGKSKKDFQFYKRYNKYHRLIGPAFIHFDYRMKSYWINDIRIKRENI